MAIIKVIRPMKYICPILPLFSPSSIIEAIRNGISISIITSTAINKGDKSETFLYSPTYANNFFNIRTNPFLFKFRETVSKKLKNNVKTIFMNYL